MRVLITGSQGRIGQVVTEQAREAGHELRTLDRQAGTTEWEHIPGDILDQYTVRRAAQGCDAVIHLAAIPGEWSNQMERVFNTNVQGTWNVLQAAAECGVKKLVSFSSVNALGIWGGMRRPDYLPVDDNHPAYPLPSYGLSKHVGEQLCESFTRKYGIQTLCLRPCWVTSQEQFERGRPMRRGWMTGDYYSYVDVRDVARAALGALDARVEHGRYLVTAAQNAPQIPTAEILQQDYADIPWIAPPEYLEDPCRSLVNTAAAWNDFGWKPLYSYRYKLEESA